MSGKILIIQGHPDPQGGRLCHGLADAYTAGAREAGHEVETIDVTHLEFPLLRGREDFKTRPVPDAIRETQSALLRAEHIVLCYPIWNGTAPALLRGFLEQTFRPAFCFPDMKPDERLTFRSAFSQRKRLAGRSGRLVVTMAMPAAAYRWYFRPHPEKNTLRLGGIDPIRESLVGQAEAPGPRRRIAWLAEMRALGRQSA